MRRKSSYKKRMKGFFNDWFDNNYRTRNPKAGKNLPEKYMEMRMRAFHPAKFYYYKYDPITKDKLAFYDREPLMFSMGQKFTKEGKMLELGINFHFIPERMRRLILDMTFDYFQSDIQYNYKLITEGKVSSQRVIDFMSRYDVFKKYLIETGWMFAIRSYYPKQMKTPPKIVSYEDWHKIITLDSQMIVGAAPKQIYDEYYKMKAVYKSKSRRPPKNVK